MRFIFTLVIVLVLLAAGAMLYAWSGMYNIAATHPHWPVTKAFIELLVDRSIEAHGEGIQAPDLKDPELIKAAFPHYHEMCRLCHGAPAFEPEEFAQGLYPQPPSMTSGDIQKELSEAEIYWVVKNGLKMSGMPAFGPTHNESQLWGLVAIAKEMPAMSAEQYQHLLMESGSQHESAHGHTHEHTE